MQAVMIWNGIKSPEQRINTPVNDKAGVNSVNGGLAKSIQCRLEPRCSRLLLVGWWFHLGSYRCTWSNCDKWNQVGPCRWFTAEDQDRHVGFECCNSQSPCISTNQRRLKKPSTWFKNSALFVGFVEYVHGPLHQSRVTPSEPGSLDDVDDFTHSSPVFPRPCSLEGFLCEAFRLEPVSGIERAPGMLYQRRQRLRSDRFILAHVNGACRGGRSCSG